MILSSIKRGIEASIEQQIYNTTSCYMMKCREFLLRCRREVLALKNLVVKY
jgi:hypothetical protein